MSITKVVERVDGQIAKVYEVESDNPLIGRVADLEKALALQVESNRLVEARFTELLDSLMRETKEQRETITALRETLRAAGAELRTVVGIADRRSREADHLRRSLRSAEASYDLAHSEARSLREAEQRRRRMRSRGPKPDRLLSRLIATAPKD